MSNIYDSANELSRGLRELPESRLLRQLKMRFRQMLRQVKSLQSTLLSKRKFKD